MTDKELRKLSRKDLLQMLIEQSQEVQALREKLSEAEAALADRTIAIDQAGSIAEAALQLNGIFQVAQDSCQQYIDNVRQLCQRQEEKSAQLEEESEAKAKKIIEEAEKFKADVEHDTKLKCAMMTREAKEQSQAYWDEVSARLKNFCEEHSVLRKLLSIEALPKDGNK